MVEPDRRDDGHRGEAPTLAAHPGAVAAAVAAEPLRVDEAIAPPPAARRDEMPEPREIRRGDHHPAGAAANGRAADLIGRIEVRVRIRDQRVEVALVLDPATQVPVPAVRGNAQRVEDALL